MKKYTGLDLELHMKKDFYTAFDFGYTLIDLQAIFSSFFYTLDVEVPNDIHELKEGEEYSKFHVAAMEPKDKEKIKRNAEAYKGNLPTTSRRFSKKYSGALKISKIESGSLLLKVASGLLTGLLLEFLKKYIWKKDDNESNKINVDITYNKNINISNKKFIEIEKEMLVDGKINKEIYNPEKYINNIISKVNIDPENPEKSIRSFLKVLHKEQVLKESQNYNERGVKSLSKDIDRFTGKFVDDCV